MRQIVVTTVTTPATATAPVGPYDLSTLEVVKDELRIGAGNTVDDVWLQRAITRGSVAMATYCNRTFVPETLQDQIFLQMDSFPSQVPGAHAPLQLSRYPLTPQATDPDSGLTTGGVISVSVNQGVNVANLLTLGTDFMVDYQKAQLIRLNSFTKFPVIWETAPTTVSFFAGYATIPSDLEQALLRWVAGAFQSRSRDPYLRAQEQPGLGRQEFWIPQAAEGAFTPEIAEMLDRYREIIVR